MSTPSDLPLDVLVVVALDEVRDDADKPWLHVVELQSRASDEVLDLALAWSVDDDPDLRDLGILVLRELGPADDAGRRPFSDRVVPHLLALLDGEEDAATERSLLTALAFNGATEALDEYLRRLDHPDDGVRSTVAFHLPYLTDPGAPAAEVIDALERLTHDADGEVRHFALYALVAEDGFVVDPERALRVARSLAEDPDPQVREMARAHSGERIATPLGPLVLTVTCGDALGMPSATSVLPSGARTARWDGGDVVVDALVVPYTWESEVLGHPRCTCWGVEWRLHARADTAPILVSARLPEFFEGSPGGDERLATTEFGDDGYVLAIGGPDDQAFAEEVEAGLHAPSWRSAFELGGPYGPTWLANGLTWQLPALLRGESAATHVTVAWTRSDHDKAYDAVTQWAVEVTRGFLRTRAGIRTEDAGRPRTSRPSGRGRRATMTNRLTLVPGTSPHRFGLAFWELTVDGRPLRELLEFTNPEDRRLDAAGLGPAGENVPVLVHNWPAAGVDGALELTGERPPELVSGRVLLYVCPACGDVGCGAVSAAVERSERTVVWRDFGWDVGWDDGEDEIRFAGGPFVFDRDQYDAELRRFVDTYDAVRASVPDLTALVGTRPRGRGRRWGRSRRQPGE